MLFKTWQLTRLVYQPQKRPSPNDRMHFLILFLLIIMDLFRREQDLVIFIYLPSLPVAHLSDAPRRRLVVTGDCARIQDETKYGSLTCSAYSTVTRELSLMSHPKDY